MEHPSWGSLGRSLGLPERQETIVGGCLRPTGVGLPRELLSLCTRRWQDTTYMNSRGGWQLSSQILEAGTEYYCCRRYPMSKCHTWPTPHREPAQPATAKDSMAEANFPGGVLDARVSCNHLLVSVATGILYLCCCRHFMHIPAVASLSFPGLSQAQCASISCCFCSLLPGWGTDAWEWPTHRDGVKTKAEPQVWCH